MKEAAVIIWRLLALFALIYGVGCERPNEGDRAVVELQLGGRKFNVPIQYMYGDAIDRNTRLPEGGEKDRRVDYLKIDALLPDLQPYNDANRWRWKVRGHGDRLSVALRVSRNDQWFETLRRVVLPSFYRSMGLSEEAPGLVRYSGQLSDRYVPENGQALVITCDDAGSADYPSCRVKSQYSENLVLEYYYAREYVGDWSSINSSVVALFDSFLSE